MTRAETIADFFRARRIAVVGATDKVERFGSKIFRYLRGRGHDVVPIHPRLDEVDGIAVARRLEDVDPPVDAINLVVNPAVGIDVVRSAAALGVKRIWAQPGAESPEIAAAAEEAGLEYVEGCVLVDGPAHPPLTGEGS